VSQQAGMTELARPLGRLGGWEHRVYVQAWFRAKQFWTDQKWIRITDQVRAPEFMKVNEPVTVAQALEAAQGGDKEAIEALSQIIPPEALQAAAQGDPMATQMIQQFAAVNGEMPIMVKNRLAEMDVDIILDTVPDTSTLQEEVWGELRELASAGLDIFSPQFELMIEMSPLSDKARVIERLKKSREEGQQAQAEQAQKIAKMEEEGRQLAMAEAQAKIRKMDSETALNEVKATAEAADTMNTLAGGNQQLQAA